MINQAVNIYGVHKWGAISSLLVGRSPQECRERWIRVLQYQRGVGVVDDSKLLELYRLFGDAWDVISNATSLSPTVCKSRVYSLLGLESSSSDFSSDLPSHMSDGNVVGRPAIRNSPVTGPALLHKSDINQDKEQPISNRQELVSTRRREYTAYLKHRPKRKSIRNIHCSHSKRTPSTATVADYQQYIRDYIHRNRIRPNIPLQQTKEASALKEPIFNTGAASNLPEKYYPPVSLYSIYAKMNLSQQYTAV